MTDTQRTEPEAPLVKFREAISCFLKQWPDWRPTIRPGADERTIFLQRDLVTLTLTLTGDRDQAIKPALSIADINGTEIRWDANSIPMRLKQQTITARLMTLIADYEPLLQPVLNRQAALIAQRRPDTAILNELRQAVGGQLNGALRLTSEGLPNGPFLKASAREPGSFHLELKGLTGPQLLAVGRLLAEQASAANWLFPHPARTLHVDDTGAVTAIDHIIAADPATGRSQTRRIVWRLEDEEWSACARFGSQLLHLLTVAGSCFPGDDDFGEAVANFCRQTGCTTGPAINPPEDTP